MISLITAVHNGLEMNKLFWEYLRLYTFHPFELIVIDNNSSDGSADFFAKAGARVIHNSDNYSYPVCQNQGIHASEGDVLVFINNDVLVSHHWDKYLLEAAQEHGLEIITPVSLENMGEPLLTRSLKRKWLRIRNTLSLFGYTHFTLTMMHRLMYGNWGTYCQKRNSLYGTRVAEGILGHTVMMKRSALAKVGHWDQRIQGADFDLFFRTRQRYMEIGDIKPVHMALGVAVHHYIRLTIKSSAAPFADRQNLISVEQKWGVEAYNKYAAFMG